MPTDLTPKVISLLLLIAISYFGFRTVYKSKKVPIEWRIITDLVNISPLYAIYNWIEIYLETRHSAIAY